MFYKPLNSKILEKTLYIFFKISSVRMTCSVVLLVWCCPNGGRYQKDRGILFQEPVGDGAVSRSIEHDGWHYDGATLIIYDFPATKGFKYLCHPRITKWHYRKWMYALCLEYFSSINTWCCSKCDLWLSSQICISAWDVWQCKQDTV